MHIFGKRAISIFNKVKLNPLQMNATLARINIAAIFSPKVDSKKYDASLGEIDTHIATKSDLNARHYDASIADFNGDVDIKTNIVSQSVDAAAAQHDKTVHVSKTIDAVAVGLSLGVAKNDVANHTLVDVLSPDGAVNESRRPIKICSASGALDAGSVCINFESVQQIYNTVEPSYGQAHFVNVGVSTYDNPSIIAFAAGKTYGSVDVVDTAEVFVDPDIFSATDASTLSCILNKTDVAPTQISSVSSDDSISTASASVSFEPGQNSAVNINSDIKSSIITTFAPIAKTIEWFDPIIADGELLIRQAYEINKNNNTLEVV